MQLAVGLHFGAWLLLWLALFTWIKFAYPDSAAARVLGVLSA